MVAPEQKKSLVINLKMNQSLHDEIVRALKQSPYSNISEFIRAAIISKTRA